MPPKSSFALKEENVMKNRFEAAVPFDRNRVVLSPLIGYVELSYINASFIKVRIYFATQKFISYFRAISIRIFLPKTQSVKLQSMIFGV